MMCMTDYEIRIENKSTGIADIWREVDIDSIEIVITRRIKYPRESKPRSFSDV